mmetsp:Transcript_8890/g.26984  ORF Transcript_8890/g.26984 Transcript_8890/m.26984 type:complete len:253 (+) Transcript_8890:631-1389(+)
MPSRPAAASARPRATSSTSWYSSSVSLPTSMPTPARAVPAGSGCGPGSGGGGGSASSLAHVLALLRGAMSWRNSASFGSSSASAPAAPPFFLRFCSAALRSSAPPSTTSGPLAAACARSRAELPSECRLQGRGMPWSPYLRANSTVMRNVSMNVLLKYFSAALASASDLKPMKAICRDWPSLVLRTLTSVSSPLAPKCSRRRLSSAYLGRFFTHSRDEDGVSFASVSMSMAISGGSSPGHRVGVAEAHPNRL